MDMIKNQRVVEFLDSICSRVLLKGKVAEIRREYLSHIEDAVDAGIQSGLSKDQAITDAICRLGNPVMIGAALNRVHRPLLHLPVSRAVALVILVVTTHVVVFGGRAIQLLHGGAFATTVLFGGILAVVLGNKNAIFAAWRSTTLPVAALSGGERALAMGFFSKLSKHIQWMTFLVGAVSLVGIYLDMQQPHMIGRWVATGFLANLYGLVFGILLTGMHVGALKCGGRTRPKRIRSRFSGGKASVFLQGIIPVLVLFGLIRIFNQLDSPEKVIRGIWWMGGLFLLGVVLVALLSGNPAAVRVPGLNQSLIKRLKTVMPLFWTFPLFMTGSVGMVLIAVWKS